MEKLDIKNKADIDTSLPIISIVGRPNVGKSTLFNRLIGKRRAIIDPTPGVTRDPIPEEWLLYNNRVTLVDTGGVKIEKDKMDSLVSDKSLSLLKDSSVILFVLDCLSITREDLSLSEKIRPYADKVIVVVNKIDDENRDDLLWDYYKFGFSNVVGISAIHGRGIEELEDMIFSFLNLEKVLDEPEEKDSIHISIMGKPNTGKSTLINLLTGHNVSIVSDIPGTTRDVMRAEFTYKGTDFTVLDTAGIRRKGKVDEDVEYYSVNRAIKTIDESDVVLLLVDIQEGITEQDKKISSLVVREGKGIILCLNKIDKLQGIPNEIEAIKDRTRFLFPLLSFAPLVTLSALQGLEIGKLLDTSYAVYKQLNKRVDTSILNNALKSWLLQKEPPRFNGGYYKVYYATQISSNPVRFLFFVNSAKDFPDSYISYLKNCIRKDLGFPNVPVDIVLRERKRNESLNKRGPDKKEVEVQKIIQSRKKTTSSKGLSNKPGGKARIGKEKDRAMKIFKNTKNKRKK